MTIIFTYTRHVHRRYKKNKIPSQVACNKLQVYDFQEDLRCILGASTLSEEGGM